ncbi:NAD(P)H-binding protein [Kribbella sindirgiensis]|uniref:NAD-dependent epimerase/dehydratase family protein n=1 Tax=Kribbella sindirgiensis TaxID=1124744 RepID=A0A4R0I741_9ACTN|nr:NAD(P)H-binding protein [Kribbella sindirgiensis]TCC26100.1 NAD-dependent epimerase/dehydratase family protein [Kribbella sindirgiensis]
MIVITGATGNVGRPLVQTLTAAGEDVVPVSRHLENHGAGHQADLTNPASLKPALDGAKAVFLLTSADFLANGNLQDVVDVIRDAGVPRVVLLSSQGVGTKRHPSIHEDAVTGSGLDWTILRPGNFASNAFAWADPVRTQRALAAPFADVALPAVDPQDIAEVAAAALRDSSHNGAIYTLTGPEPISPRQQAAVIEQAIGEPIDFTELTRDQARANMLTFMPAPVVEATLDVLGTPSPAEQQVSPDVENVLGRPPRAFADWVSRNVAAFR